MSDDYTPGSYVQRLLSGWNQALGVTTQEYRLEWVVSDTKAQPCIDNVRDLIQALFDKYGKCEDYYTWKRLEAISKWIGR